MSFVVDEEELSHRLVRGVAQHALQGSAIERKRRGIGKRRR
jgi:hypothetical protein